VSRMGNRIHPGRYAVGCWRNLEALEAQSHLERMAISSDRITVVRCVYHEGSDFPEHFHPQEQLTIVEEGTLEVTVEGEKISVGKGEMITVAPNIRHATSVQPGVGRVVALNIFLRLADRRNGVGSGVGVSTIVSPAR